MTGCSGGSVYTTGVSYFPNGDIRFANDSINGNWTYTYDGFNRLSTAVSSNGSGCSEGYDRYGNRWQQNAYNGTCFTPQFSFTGNNNRMDGYSYDAAGNLLSDGTYFYQYDARAASRA